MKQLLKGGVRGKYAERYRAGTNLFRLAPDVANAFPTEDAVTEALRLAMKLAQLPVGVLARDADAPSGSRRADVGDTEGP